MVHQFSLQSPPGVVFVPTFSSFRANFLPTTLFFWLRTSFSFSPHCPGVFITVLPICRSSDSPASPPLSLLCPIEPQTFFALPVSPLVVTFPPPPFWRTFSPCFFEPFPLTSYVLFFSSPRPGPFDPPSLTHFGLRIACNWMPSKIPVRFLPRFFFSPPPPRNSQPVVFVAKGFFRLPPPCCFPYKNFIVPFFSPKAPAGSSLEVEYLSPEF